MKIILSEVDMRLSKLLSDSGIIPTCEITDCEITEIVTDSRKTSLGCMFICISGAHADGHRHIREAMLRGAVAVVVQKGASADIPSGCPFVNVIEHESTRRASALLYSAWYGNPAKKLKIIGVTGTNGKTSVTYMLKNIFEAALFRCGLIGTVCCASGERRIYASPDDPLANMTTPDPCQLYRLLAFMAADKVDYVFMEVSSHALRLCKADGIKFDAAIFTNLTPEHLDFHGNMDDYRDSKAKLFSLADMSIINGDDRSASYMAQASRGRAYTYSLEGRVADFCAESIVNNGSHGINYTLRSKNTIMKLRSPIPGMFTVYNTLCASACALLHGISPSLICASVGSMVGVEGRMERVKLPVAANISAFIDYAHTPDALENLLNTARKFRSADQRIVLVFGCGGDRDKSKRRIMGEVASRLADLSIVTSDNSRGENADDIISEICAGFDEKSQYKIIKDRREAIEYAIVNSRRGDIILLAGKGHERYEIDSLGKHDFDERKIAIECAEKHFGEK